MRTDPRSAFVAGSTAFVWVDLWGSTPISSMALGNRRGVAQLAGRPFRVAILAIDFGGDALRKVRGVIHVKVSPRAARQVLLKLFQITHRPDPGREQQSHQIWASPLPDTWCSCEVVSCAASGMRQFVMLSAAKLLTQVSFAVSSGSSCW